MKGKKYGILLGVALASTVYADDKVSYQAQTKMEKSSDGSVSTDTSAESTDAAGTTRKATEKKESKVKSNGTKEYSSVSKTSTDPKGLMNKSTSEVRTSGSSDARGKMVRKSSADTVNAQGDEFSTDKKKKTDVKSDGTVETTTTKDITADPSGLGNKATGKVVTKTTTNPDGTSATRTTKSINGKTIEDTDK